MPTLDDFIKLNDAQISRATAQATIASQMLDMQIKAAKAKQEVIKLHLENVARFLDIRWDMQAHRDLQTTIHRARRKARLLEDEGQLLERRLRDLAAGLFVPEFASSSMIRDGWIGFKLILTMAASAGAEALSAVKVTKGMKSASNWHDPVAPTEPEGESFPALLNWARLNSAAPIGEAGEAFRSVIDALSKGAEDELTAINAELEKAEKAAIELAKIDWARLGTIEEEEG